MAIQEQNVPDADTMKTRSQAVRSVWMKMENRCLFMKVRQSPTQRVSRYAPGREQESINVSYVKRYMR